MLKGKYNYEYMDQIGIGGFCEVFKAKELNTGKIVAIKRPSKAKIENKILFKKICTLMIKEANIMKRLDHPHIVKILDYFENENGVNLVQEFATGGDLFFYLLNKKFLKEFQTALIVSQILSGIRHVHDMGFAHRDIKLENILVMNKYADTFKVSDFGLSRHVNGYNLETICGTIEYSAPELIQHNMRKYYGAEVDSWSIGVITYVLICGYMPFHSTARNAIEIKEQILAGDYKFHSPWWDKISPNAKSFISQLLETNPSKRLSISQAQKHPWLIEYKKMESNLSGRRLRCLILCFIITKQLASIIDKTINNETTNLQTVLI